MRLTDKVAPTIGSWALGLALDNDHKGVVMLFEGSHHRIEEFTIQWKQPFRRLCLGSVGIYQWHAVSVKRSGEITALSRLPGDQGNPVPRQIATLEDIGQVWMEPCGDRFNVEFWLADERRLTIATHLFHSCAKALCFNLQHARSIRNPRR